MDDVFELPSAERKAHRSKKTIDDRGEANDDNFSPKVSPRHARGRRSVSSRIVDLSNYGAAELQRDREEMKQLKIAKRRSSESSSKNNDFDAEQQKQLEELSQQLNDSEDFELTIDYVRPEVEKNAEDNNTEKSPVLFGISAAGVLQKLRNKSEPNTPEFSAVHSSPEYSPSSAVSSAQSFRKTPYFDFDVVSPNDGDLSPRRASQSSSESRKSRTKRSLNSTDTPVSTKRGRVSRKKI